MNFNEFQNQSRLYVIGALEPEELEEFENARLRYATRRALTVPSAVSTRLIAKPTPLSALPAGDRARQPGLERHGDDGGARHAADRRRVSR